MQIGDDEPKRLSKASQHDGSGDLLILIKRSLLSIPLSLKAGFYFYFYFYFWDLGSFALRFFIKHRYLHKKKVFLPEIKCIYKEIKRGINLARGGFHFISLNFIEPPISYPFFSLHRFSNSISISPRISRLSLRFSRRVSPLPSPLPSVWDISLQRPLIFIIHRHFSPPPLINFHEYLEICWRNDDTNY